MKKFILLNKKHLNEYLNNYKKKAKKKNLKMYVKQIRIMRQKIISLYFVKDTVSKNTLRDVLKSSFKYAKNEMIDMLIRTAEDELDSADSSRVEYKFLFNEVDTLITFY